jgi:quercetin dioxygenase-like cupin family protein
MQRLEGVVSKAWGREVIFATNEKYCGKLLCFDKAGGKFSLHFHAEKDESWYVLNGSFELEVVNTKDASTMKKVLSKGDTWRNLPNLPHRLISLEDDSIIIEVSTPDSVEDNYRISPGDSQNGSI